MTSTEIKDKIDKLNKSIASPATPSNLIPKMREQKEALEAKYLEVYEQEEAEEARRLQEEEEAQRLRVDAEKNKPPKPKRTVTPEMKAEVNTKLDDCKKIIAEMRASEKSQKKSREKSEKKPVSEKLVHGLIRSVSGAVSKELTMEKVVKIKPQKLRDAMSAFESALKAMRQALGGISDENDTIIKEFRSAFTELIDKVESLQDQIKQAA